MVSVSTVDRFGYTCIFVNRKVSIKDIEKCASCIKGKNTHTTGKGSSRAKKLLQLIHTYTCQPFPIATRNGH